MRVLILGGAGFVGSNLVRKYLAQTDAKITVVDSLDLKLKSDFKNLEAVQDKITFTQGDMRDSKLMEEVVKSQDVIINCAAQTSHILSVQEPLYDADINCLGNLTLLEAIRKKNPKVKILYISSSTVLGKRDEQESGEAHPCEIYSANKGVAENYYLIYHRVYELQAAVLRFGNLYGSFGKPYSEFGFMNYFISLAQNNQALTVYGEGKQLRNVLYIEDATDLILQYLTLNSVFEKVYLVASNEHYSVIEIAEKIVDVFGSGKVEKIPWPDIRKKIEIQDAFLDGGELSKIVPWKPQFDLVAGLRELKEKQDMVDA